MAGFKNLAILADNLVMKKLLKWPAISWLTTASLSCALNNPYIPTVLDRLPDQMPSQSSAAEEGPPAEPPDPNQDSNQPAEGRSPRVRHNAFLYDIIPDTISALTCPVNVHIGNQNFTLNVGAYRKHGLQLSEQFKRNHNIQTNTPPQRVRRLIEESHFKGARARIALHDESDVDKVLRAGGIDLLANLPRFDNPSVLDFLSRGLAVFSSRSGSASNSQNSGKFQAGLPLDGASFIEWLPSLGEDTLGNSLLAITYVTPPRNQTNGIWPVIYTERGRPYGRSYKIEFNSPYKADFMTEIKEESLPEVKREGNWECPRALRFMIHRSLDPYSSSFNKDIDEYEESLKGAWNEDMGWEGYCNQGDYRPSSAERALQTAAFRDIFGKDELSQLPFYVGETWTYDPRERESDEPTGWPCIKFKKPGCYLNNGFYRLEFDPEKLRGCVPLSQIESGRSANPDYYRICPAFFSICLRKN